MHENYFYSPRKDDEGGGDVIRMVIEIWGILNH
jgi:hypothetical protein